MGGLTCTCMESFIQLLLSYNMKKTNCFAKAVLYAVATFLFMACATSYAQRVNQLTVSTFSSGYSTIKGQAGTVTLATLSGSISGQYSFSMPFAFKFDNNLYASGSTLYVQVGGSASFVSNTGSSYNNILTYGTPSLYNSAMAVCSIRRVPTQLLSTIKQVA
jgi:hypothetical protein